MHLPHYAHFVFINISSNSCLILSPYRSVGCRHCNNVASSIFHTHTYTTHCCVVSFLSTHFYGLTCTLDDNEKKYHVYLCVFSMLTIFPSDAIDKRVCEREKCWSIKFVIWLTTIFHLAPFVSLDFLQKKNANQVNSTGHSLVRFEATCVTENYLQSCVNL